DGSRWCAHLVVYGSTADAPPGTSMTRSQPDGHLRIRPVPRSRTIGRESDAPSALASCGNHALAALWWRHGLAARGHARGLVVAGVGGGSLQLEGGAVARGLPSRGIGTTRRSTPGHP